jgi:hypothetical protein
LPLERREILRFSGVPVCHNRQTTRP